VDDPYLSAMKALDEKPGALDLRAQINLHFALAKAHSDLGEHDRSFRHQLKGNALKRQTLSYDNALIQRRFEELRLALNAEWLRHREGAGNSSALPVFIVGMPRLGITLIEQILASHPKFHAGGERTDFERALATVCGTAALPPRFVDIAARWAAPELRRLGVLYLDAVRRDAPASAERITDKMPPCPGRASSTCVATPWTLAYPASRSCFTKAPSHIATISAIWAATIALTRP
jgi:Sulfotransferase family